MRHLLWIFILFGSMAISATTISAQTEESTEITLDMLLDGCTCVTQTGTILQTPCGDKDTCDGKSCAKDGIFGVCVSDRNFIYNPETQAFELDENVFH